MKAYLIDGVRQHRVGEIPTPKPGAGEVLVKVMAAGLCGTDAHIYNGEYFGSYPIVPGHEFSGIVEETGPGALHFAPGDRVSADPNIFCENCSPCKRNMQNFCDDFAAAGVSRNGAMAQYLVIPEKCVFPIGEIDFTLASMIEPLACVVHGQNMLAPRLASRVLVVGAGAIGLMHVQISKMNGASFVAVSDLKEDRLSLARELGADLAIPSGDVPDYVKEHGGFDVVIDSTGVPAAVEQAIPYVADAGRFLIFGVCPNDSKISINPYEIFKRELTILGSFALRKTFGQAVRLAEQNRVVLEPLVGARIELEDMPRYMEDFAAGKTFMKTIVFPNGKP